MEDYQAIIPAPPGSEGYVELSRTQSGRLFRKHILNLGKDVLIHPDTGRKLTLDDTWFNQLRKNFHDKSVVDIVQFPVADDRNKHVETPLSNLGEVMDIERDGNKVYAVIDVRKNAEDVGKTILGASAMLHMNYKRSEDGQRVGPALVHVCATNRPYITKLDDYSEVVAASRDDSADMDFDAPVILTSEEDVPDLTQEELEAQLKNRFGTDVAALRLAAEQRADLSGLAEALKGTLNLSGDSLEQSDVVGAIVELNAKNEKLEGEVLKLTRKDAERVVEGYIGAGRLLPKSKDRAVKIYLSDPSELEDFLSPADAPYVPLEQQVGLTGAGDGEQKHDFDIDQEIDRLGNVAAGLGGAPGKRK